MPFSSPKYKKSYSLDDSKKHTDSGVAGNTCKHVFCSQFSVSKENILQVLSANPTAKNLLLTRPSGTYPMSMHLTSLSNILVWD